VLASGGRIQTTPNVDDNGPSFELTGVAFQPARGLLSFVRIEHVSEKCWITDDRKDGEQFLCEVLGFIIFGDPAESSINSRYLTVS
jgi:hypothetical protein